MKQILAIAILIFTQFSISAQDVVSRNSVGFFGSYYMSSLQNSDDMKKLASLKLETTLNYGGGVESIHWFNENFGHGLQLGYFKMGQNYSGLDTSNKYTYKAATTFNNIKINYLVHFHSFDRYNPGKKLKFNASFGPYIALNNFFTDKYTLYDNNGKEVSSFVQNPTTINYSSGAVPDLTLTKPIYKLFDAGFVLATGVEYILGKKTTVYFNLRTDIGTENVENRGNIKIKTTSPPYELDYNRWDGLGGGKFGFTNIPNLDKYDTRPATKNFLVGAAIGLRVYNRILRN
jgi:opacity protein-like surface antigen